MDFTESAEVFSSSLGLSRPETPPLNQISPPPPKEIENYKKKELPLVPLKRQSGVSTFSKEVDEALATPGSVTTPDEGSIYLIYRPSMSPRAAPDDGDAEFLGNLDQQNDGKQNREELKLDTAGLPTSAPTNVPTPKGAQLAGIMGAKQNTPSGHRSFVKVERLTGNKLAYDGDQSPRQPVSHRRRQLHGEVSPLSNSSSACDFEEPRAAVSDLDADSGTYSSEPSPNDPGSTSFPRRSTGPTAIPRPLHAAKPTRPSRSPERKPPLAQSYGSDLPLLRSNVEARRAFGRRRPSGTPSDYSSPDQYHEMIRERAKDDAVVAYNASRAEQDPAKQLGQFVEETRASIADRDHKPSSPGLPSKSHRHRGKFQQVLFSDSDRSGDDGGSGKIGQPPRSQPTSPHTGGTDTFGPIRRLYAHLPTSHSKSPGPGQHSKTECDSDNYHSIGTPDTGGSIPISLASSDQNRETNGRRRRRHSSSAVAKGLTKAIFRRKSNTSTAPHNNNPSTPVPSSVPTSTSAKRASRHHHHPHPYHHHTPSPPSNSSTSDFHHHHHHHHHTSAPSLRTRAGTAAAAVAAEATKATSQVSKTVVGLFKSLEERRQQDLKRSIRVERDGRQVFAAGASASASGLGLGLDLGADLGGGARLPPGSLPGGGGGGQVTAAGAAGATGAAAAGGGEHYRGRMGSAPAAMGAEGLAIAPRRLAVRPLLGQGLDDYARENAGAWHRQMVMSSEVAPDMGRATPGQRARVSPVPGYRGSLAHGIGPSPRSSPRPRRQDGGPSPRPSRDGGREQGLGDRGGVGVGVGVGVV